MAASSPFAAECAVSPANPRWEHSELMVRIRALPLRMKTFRRNNRREQQGCSQIGVDDGRYVILAGLDEQRVLADRSVVDETIQWPQPVLGCGDEPLQSLGIRRDQLVTDAWSLRVLLCEMLDLRGQSP
ncbi:MAG: hypothetical protein U5Q16_04855 [Gammaproteobacteria bacterium]|nr:hypothetical protein [Gammaproteobacteria bacterium]